MPCRLSSLLLARHVPPQRSIQIYRSVLEILLVIFEFARKKNGDKMFRVQTHQVLLTCNLTCTLRIAIFMHLGRQISRCFWVLDHLKNLTCRAFSRLSGMALEGSNKNCLFCQIRTKWPSIIQSVLYLVSTASWRGERRSALSRLKQSKEVHREQRYPAWKNIA
jgi:hypothetical protein